MKAKSCLIIMVLSCIVFTASDSYGCSNIPPIADLDIPVPYLLAFVGETVTLDGSDSYDPDGSGGINGIVKFEWDFRDPPHHGFYCDYYETSEYYPDEAFDGKTEHIYYSTGIKLVRLRVTDADDANDMVIDEVYVVVIKNFDTGAGYETIQDAIDAAVSGEELWVLQGTYTLSSLISVNKPISIYGGFDGTESQRSDRDWETNTTTIDGDNIGLINCFYIIDCTTIDGFTITNAGTDYFDPGNGISCYGGSTTITNCNITNNGTGISCYLSSSPTISNCAFSGNGETYATLYSGGGISIGSSSSPTITNCEFSQNVAGGIKCSSSSGTISISGCEFSSNSAGTGGAIYCHDSSPTISYCVFTENGAYGFMGDGGAISCFESSPTIEDCVFTDNTADGDGGAIYCTPSSSFSPTIERCVFSGNTAEYDGGGLYASFSTPELINCLFINNEAENGGGIATWKSEGSSVINCTFYGNASLGTYPNRGGGAVYAKASFPYYCSTTMRNCILWGNTAVNDGHEVCCDGDSYTYKAIVTLKYCDIQDTTGWMFEVDEDNSEVRYLPYSIYKNIYDDPDFVSPGSPKGNDNEWATSDDGFVLGTTDCINNGDDVTGSPHYISDDITGGDRKIGGYVDIGAYEYGN